MQFDRFVRPLNGALLGLCCVVILGCGVGSIPTSEDADPGPGPGPTGPTPTPETIIKTEIITVTTTTAPRTIRTNYRDSVHVNNSARGTTYTVAELYTKVQCGAGATIVSAGTQFALPPTVLNSVYNETATVREYWFKVRVTNQSFNAWVVEWTSSPDRNWIVCEQTI